MIRVILETPYKGKDWSATEGNLRFARLCGHDCIVHGEAYFASHLLYTQEEVLDDKIAAERALGIEAGFARKEVADATVIYINRGISRGMHLGIRKTIALDQPFEYRSLSGYPRAPVPNIITVSGSTGAGKTTIVGEFLKRKSEAKMITSYTSRGPRSSDLPGEYKYNVSPEYFDKHKDEFLWIAQAHGNTYGTTHTSIIEALDTPGPWLMILVPGVLLQLRNHVTALTGRDNSVLSFFVLSPGKEETRRRLLGRDGDSPETQRRIESGKEANELALESDIPYIFLVNQQPNVGAILAAEQMLIFA